MEPDKVLPVWMSSEDRAEIEAPSDIALMPVVAVTVAAGSLIERVVESSKGGKLPALVSSEPTKVEILVDGPRLIETDSRLNGEKVGGTRSEVDGPFASVLNTVGAVFGIIEIEEVWVEDKVGKAALIETDVGATVELPVIDVNVSEGDGKLSGSVVLPEDMLSMAENAEVEIERARDSPRLLVLKLVCDEEETNVRSVPPTEDRIAGGIVDDRMAKAVVVIDIAFATEVVDSSPFEESEFEDSAVVRAGPVKDALTVELMAAILIDGTMLSVGLTMMLLTE